MKWTAAIDVPMLKKSTVLAVDVLGDLHAHKIRILFRDELWYCVGPDGWLLGKVLSNIESVRYDEGIVSITTKPNLDDIKLNPDEGKEVKNQLIALHSLINDIRIYVIETKRVSVATDNLITTTNGSAVNHHLICVDDVNGVNSFLSKHTPTLNQLKHHQFDHTLDGKSVSKFSAYDENNEDEAKKLLRNSYDDYQGNIDPLLPPKHLYTWDSKHKCYVCFNHSGQWEYHGHDVEITDQNIPKYIKQKYHHTK